MKKLFAILMLVVAFVLIKCDVLEDSEAIELVFLEAQCLNPWNAHPGNNNYLFEVRNYLIFQGITISDITREKIQRRAILRSLYLSFRK